MEWPDLSRPTLEQAFLPLQQELDAWREAGRSCKFWLRDDDLAADSPNFRQLRFLTRSAGVQVMCAVIPAQLEPAFASTLQGDDNMVFAQHGYAHANHEPAGLPKSEFGAARSLAARMADLKAGWSLLEGLLGPHFFKVFVPPWNRVADDLLEPLAQTGFLGVSRHGPRGRPWAAAGLAAVNTHIDILDWGGPPARRSRPAADIARELAQILQRTRSQVHAPQEPVGILLHHRVMDSASWAVLDYLLHGMALDWESPRRMFCAGGSPGMTA